MQKNKKEKLLNLFQTKINKFNINFIKININFFFDYQIIKNLNNEIKKNQKKYF